MYNPLSTHSMPGWARRMRRLLRDNRAPRAIEWNAYCAVRPSYEYSDAR